VEDSELREALDLLGISDPAAAAAELPTSTTLLQLAEALRLVDKASRFNLPATALARWNDASPSESYGWAIAALRANVEAEEWWKLLAEVHDPVRQHLRDAQLDFIIGQRRAADGLSSREAVSDHLLADVQMSACMPSSRIQFAYLAVQRYVDAAQAGRAPGPAAGEDEERFAREWIALRQYRLAEAAARLLVHTENWVEPEIRPTKTPAFEQLEQTLQSGPLTLHSAEQALRQYAASLTDVARLETIAIVTHDEADLDRPLAFRDEELRGTHVFARTRAHPRQLYYRRRLPDQDRRWTPWERIEADLEGSHYLAVVVFGRLRLLCANFAPARQRRPNVCATDNAVRASTAVAGTPLFTDYEMSLSWIDRQHGRWSPVRRSGVMPFQVELDRPLDANYLWQFRPRDVIADFARESESNVARLFVELQFGTQLPRTGSKIDVYLVTDGGTHRVGEYSADQRSSARLEVRNPDDVNVTQINGVGLVWRPTTFFEWVQQGDDCDIDGIQVQAQLASGELVPKQVYEGRTKRLETSTVWHDGWTLVSNLRLQSGEGAQDTAIEEFRRVFEGPLVEAFDLGTVVPTPQQFEIEYEAVAETLDLTTGLRLEASQAHPGSFFVDLHGVSSASEVRMRARFRVTPETLRALPEAAGRWPDDWVSGEEFCYSYAPATGPLARVTIHADDTVEIGSRPSSSAGSHEGTATVGQQFLARGARLVFDGKQPRVDSSKEIFCEARPVAVTPHDYAMIVARDRWVSSSSSPKILEEAHTPNSEPARTFFIERLDGVPAPPAPLKPTAKPPEPPRSKQSLFLGNGTTKGKNGNETGALLLLPDRAGSQALKSFEIDNDARLDVQFDAKDYQRWMDTWSAGSMGLAPLEVWLGPAQTPWLWSFQTFWHPQAVGFRRVLESRGLHRLLRIENQELSDGTDLTQERETVHFFSDYVPRNRPDSRFVASPWPTDVVDFTIDGPFSEYNWELFFDAILYIAKRFDEEGMFEEADEMFGLLIDRPKAGVPGIWQEPTFYQTAPIRRAVAIEAGDLSGLVDEGYLGAEIVAQLERIRQNPYQPHLIARGWPSVYARALRIRYAEHLIRAGEHNFRLAYQGDNRSFLELASSRLDLAARVLGDADESMAATSGEENPCFAALVNGGGHGAESGIDALEVYLPEAITLDGPGSAEPLWGARAYFCVPGNGRLDELRAIVADRLLKLRSCRDIDGIRQAMSLYGRAIDPALLVRATAEGLDLDVLLGRISGAKPSMYFSALWSRAMQACDRARSFEDAAVGAHERLDSEALTSLQNEQEISALEHGIEIRAQQLQDARWFKEALDRSLESAKLRREFYSTREKVSALEKAEGEAMKEAGASDARAAGDARTAADWAWVPTAELYADAGGGTDGAYAKAGVSTRYRLGGETAVQAHQAYAEGHRHEAARARVEAGLIGRSAGFQRRFDEWKHQADLALKDIHRTERDLASAEIRIQVAELERDLQKQRLDDAKAIRTHLRDKFTNLTFQRWNASRLDRLRYQYYRLAYDLTVQAKAALVRELGLEDQGLVPDTWDTRYKGVGAAAGLIYELESQQRTYVETVRREQQKRKSYSLAERQPLALLELLQRGETIFSITEADLDEDSAGDWFRRISHVSIDIPAVRGPYTNVNARLTQLRGEVRTRPYSPRDADYARQGPDDTRFRDDLVNGDSIVTNSGMQDDGSLGQQRDGETPLPFVMNGAIGTFRLELSPSENHFDRSTITDVIVQFHITSRPGGDIAAAAARAARRQRISERPEAVMLPMHSMFSNAWHRFVDALADGEDAELTLALDESHVPYRLQPAARIVQTNLYFAHRDLEIVNPLLGQMSEPREFQPGGGDLRAPPPIRRCKLRSPLVLGEETAIRFRSGTPPKQGWLVCWVEGS
jgi:hypothetical protein